MMKYKKHIIAFVLSLLVIGIIYLAGTFVSLSANPKNWLEGGRFMFALFALLIIIVPQGVIYDES